MSKRCNKKGVTYEQIKKSILPACKLYGIDFCQSNGTSGIKISEPKKEDEYKYFFTDKDTPKKDEYKRDHNKLIDALSDIRNHPKCYIQRLVIESNKKSIIQESLVKESNNSQNQFFTT